MKKKISKKQLYNTKLRTCTVGDMVKKAKDTNTAIKKETKNLLSYSKNIKQTLKMFSIAEERLENFKINLSTILNKSMDHMDQATKDKEIKKSIEQIRSVLQKTNNSQ